MDKTVAILARTNLGLRPFEQMLTEAGIKYHLIGKSGFWSTEEIKGVLAYMHCVLYPQDWCLAAAIRAPFFPSKFIPKQKVLARLKEIKEQDEETSYWQCLAHRPGELVEQKNASAVRDFVGFIHGLTRYRDLPPDEALKKVLGALKVGDYFAEVEDTPDNNPIENLAELLRIAGRHRTIKDFLDFCRRASAASKSRKGVALSTCHSAKGLEFHTVYLVQCQEGMMPHAKATDLDEERNIFFVGASRAERELVISYSGIPSVFIKDVVECKQEQSDETS